MLRSGGMDRPLFLIEDPTWGPPLSQVLAAPSGSRFALCTLPKRSPPSPAIS